MRGKSFNDVLKHHLGQKRISLRIGEASHISGTDLLIIGGPPPDSSVDYVVKTFDVFCPPALLGTFLHERDRTIKDALHEPRPNDPDLVEFGQILYAFARRHPKSIRGGGFNMPLPLELSVVEETELFGPDPPYFQTWEVSLSYPLVRIRRA